MSFFIIGALLIMVNNNLPLYDEGSIEKFYDLYVEWLNRLYFNFQGITGNVIDEKWLPE